MMPTSKRVPGVFTVTVNGTQIELPAPYAQISVFPATRDEFITTLAGLHTLPGATAPISGFLAAHVATGQVTFKVYAPDDMRSDSIRTQSPEIDAAIADVMAVAS